MDTTHDLPFSCYLIPLMPFSKKQLNPIDWEEVWYPTRQFLTKCLLEVQFETFFLFLLILLRVKANMKTFSTAR